MSRAKEESKVMRKRKRDLESLPQVILEWVKNTIGDFRSRGIAPGTVMPKSPTADNTLWRIIFVHQQGVQCSECGEVEPDKEAHYSVVNSQELKWLSASCSECHNSRMNGSAMSPLEGDV